MSRGTLILTVGLPYSGKSTWARQTGLPIVSPDAVRVALHGERFLEAAEPWVWLNVRTMVDALFRAGHAAVIAEATHTTRARRDEWRSWARGRFEVQLRVMQTSAEACVRRAALSGDGEIRPVIERMRDQLEAPGPDEVLYRGDEGGGGGAEDYLLRRARKADDKFRRRERSRDREIL